jgi:hypothetical protein
LLIEADGEWAAAKAAEDPNALAAIVHRTHFTHVGGATLAMTKINMQKSFNALEQGPSRRISEFKKKFDTLVRCMRGSNIPEMDGQTSAIWFLKKLDQVRHGAMVLYLTNGRVAGQALSGHRKRGLHYHKELEELLRSSRRFAWNHRQRSNFHARPCGCPIFCRPE